MNTKIFAVLFGAAIMLCIAATGGPSGVPSRLKLTSLGVGTTAPATAGNIAITGAITGATNLPTLTGANTFSGGNTMSNRLTFTGGGDVLRIRENTNGFISFWNNAETTRAGYLEANGSGSQINLAAENGHTLQLIAGGVTGITLNATTGAVNMPAGATVAGVNICRSDGTNCPSSGPRHSFGRFVANAGGCSLNGSWQSSNISGCTRNSTGNFTVTFSVAYGGSPVCTANSAAPTVGFTAVNTSGTTSATVQAVNTSFAAADLGAFELACHGT